nr:hypothetical protein [Tanacetum cinerariifolium]
MANKTVGIGVGPVHSRNKVNHQNQFVPQAVLLRTGKVNIPHVRPQLVPTGKPKVFVPVPTSRPNRPFSVPTGRGYSPLENPFSAAQDEGIFDSGCSRSMTGNKERLDDFQAFQGRKVTFGGCEGRITGKGTIRTLTLDFENVYYVKELQQFNLLSISQICDKKNRVLFTDTECLVLSKDFKLPDDSMVVLKVPRKHNLYTINLNDLCPRGNLACLVAHASFDESMKWHRRMGHVNYKNMNRLVKGNLVRGLPPKLFKHDHTCVACCKGKQHKASYKAIHAVSVTSPHNKTPYALLTENIPSIRHLKPFGCHVTILNTSDHLGKFDGKADEGYIVGYSASNKAYKVYNVPNKWVEESMNLRLLEEKPNVQGLGHEWYFDLNYLTDTLVTFDAENLGLGFANEAEEHKTQASAKTVLPGCTPVPTGSIPVPTGSIPVPAGDIMVSTDDVPAHPSSSTGLFFGDEPTTRFPCPSDLGNQDPSPGIFSSSSYDDEFGTTLNNVASTVEVSLVATKRINTIHPQSLIIGDPTLAVQTRSKVKQTTTVEPKSVAQALEDPSWVDTMQEKMQQFKFQNVWVLVDFPAELMRKYMSLNLRVLWILNILRRSTRRGTIDKTLFLKKNNRDIILVQVYVDDIIFGSTKKAWCDEFEALMKGEFQMSVMGELTFFLGLQVQQKHDGIFINQDKYVQEILNKFDLRCVRTATTPYEALKPKSKNESDSPVNAYLYRSMIGSLMYLTASRPDIMFAVSACLRNQVTPTTLNLEAVKKIFKYLKGQPKLGLWYPKKSPLVLEAYSDSDYAGANKDRKSTTGGCILDTKSVVRLWGSWLGPPAIQATIDKTPYTITKDLVRSRLHLADDCGIDDLPIAEIYSGMDNLG